MHLLVSLQRLHFCEIAISLLQGAITSFVGFAFCAGSDFEFVFKRARYDHWQDFVEEVEVREMPYGSVITLLNLFCGSDGSESAESLAELIADFRRKVLEREVPEATCDVLLALHVRVTGVVNPQDGPQGGGHW